jgi:hypothetical protein
MCRITTDQTVCRISMKFGVEVSYEKLLKKHEFRENWLNDSRALLSGLTELLPERNTFLGHLGLNSE